MFQLSRDLMDDDSLAEVEWERFPLRGSVSERPSLLGGYNRVLMTMRLARSTVDQLCADVSFDVEKPRIDLSNVSFVEPFGLIYLGMFLRHFNSLGCSFEIVTPRSRQVRKYLDTQRFWERYNIPMNMTGSSSLPGLASFTSLRDVIDIENDQYIADDVGNMVYEILSRHSVKVSVGLVTEIVVELVDNFSRHSGQQLAACAIQLYPNLKKLHFAIGDCGVGIRDSLSKSPHYRHLSTAPHYEAAVKALEEGVTGGVEGGTGFGTVREDVVELGGQMFLCTGDGWISIEAERDDVQSGQMAYDLPGVQIEVTVSVSE